MLTKWSLALRSADLAGPDIDKALADGTILRTHMLRPTWHLVARDDIRWIQRLCAPRVQASVAHRYAELGLDARALGRSIDVLTRVLENDAHRTRDEIRDHLAAANIDTAGQRLPHMLMHAELECIICSGAPRGKTQTYALVDERAPAGHALDGDEALAELARRYFTTHGPATERDFRWWSSLRAADARRAIAAADASLERVDLDGRTFWMAPEEDLPARRVPARRASSAPAPGIYLLPVLDQYLIGYTHSRDLAFEPGAETSAFGARVGNNWIVRRGMVIGRWRSRRRGDRITVEAATFDTANPTTRREIERAARRFARFQDLQIEVRIGRGVS
jgi:hypothetical protein